MKLNQAYKWLGISEDATEQEIEYQFEKWIKKHNAIINGQANNDEFDMESITRAYETIKRHQQYKPEPTKGSESIKKKLSHFFYYYKLHSIAVLLFLLILFWGIQAVIDHQENQKKLASLPRIHVEVMFFGSFIPSSLTTEKDVETTLEENILERFPSWKRVNAIYSYSPLKVTTQSDIGIQQKSAVQLATEKPDMYIMDLKYFEAYVSSGMFYPLDKISSVSLAEKRKLHFSQTQTTDTEHLYGVELTDTSLFTGIPFQENTKLIAAIRKDAKNVNQALDLIMEFSD
ncbi:hypothetical protein [Radiobacillus deserti]|uniref:J domain-containing protein n=1 Tax=Radiobacillus deserti TaxID=2594883 RepID=A0A516KJ73_9BACI|nr:hypothetical protein [Radiobacillus deserti]QDP41426.1 hypothetical protein FN924_15295 [Radiobacillus deserti]